MASGHEAHDYLSAEKVAFFSQDVGFRIDQWFVYTSREKTFFRWVGRLRDRDECHHRRGHRERAPRERRQ